jgi:hypothetical protein
MVSRVACRVYCQRVVAVKFSSLHPVLLGRGAASSKVRSSSTDGRIVFSIPRRHSHGSIQLSSGMELSTTQAATTSRTRLTPFTYLSSSCITSSGTTCIDGSSTITWLKRALMLVRRLLAFTPCSVLIMKLRSEVINSISSYFGWRKRRDLASLIHCRLFKTSTTPYRSTLFQQSRHRFLIGKHYYPGTG